MTHNCRMGWLPNAQMIADGMPDAPKAKPPAMLRRPATEFKGECFDARDMAHPAAKAVNAPVVACLDTGTIVPQFDTMDECLGWARRHFDTSGMSVIDVVTRVKAMCASQGHPASDADVPATPAQAEPEWIEWGGGDCPLGSTGKHQLRFRAGSEHTIEGCPDWLRWDHQGLWSDIVAYRVLSEPAAPKADAEGWIEWKGGECPVPLDARVEINRRCGLASIGSPRKWLPTLWEHLGDGLDIVAYRVLP